MTSKKKVSRLEKVSSIQRKGWRSKKVSGGRKLSISQMNGNGNVINEAHESMHCIVYDVFMLCFIRDFILDVSVCTCFWIGTWSMCIPLQLDAYDVILQFLA